MPSYTKPKSNIARRAEALNYGQNGPGLYNDETLVKLTTGQLVAVSVERHWADNGGGIAFHGYARAINADGSTIEIEGGKHVEAAISFHAPPLVVSEHGADALATDIAKIILGEPPVLTKLVPVDDAPPESRPVVDLPPELIANATIAFQLQMVDEAKKTTINI